MINDEFCGPQDSAIIRGGVNFPIDGRMPVSSLAVKTYPFQRVTALATEVINSDDTVAFLGTSDGYLRKVHFIKLCVWQTSLPS